MKKAFKIILLSVVMSVFFSMTAFADMGSKPRVEIKLSNPPDELYYMDLLYFYDGDTNELYDSLDENREKYNQEMLDKLFTFTDENLYPALAAGTSVPTWGNLIPDENGSNIYGYHGVPSEFKVIIVTESGEIKTTEMIQRKHMELSISLNYKDMSYTTQPVWKAYIGQFAITCSLTLIVEFLILLLFRFNIKQNIKTFAFANIFTQIVFTIAFSTMFINSGTFSTILFFYILEFFVIIAEVCIYLLKFKGKSKGIIIAYTIVANVASAALTFVNIDKLFDIMFSLIR